MKESQVKFTSEKSFEEFLMGNQGFLAESLGIEKAELYQQLSLGGYGIPDIVAFEPIADSEAGKWINIHIIELKNGPISHYHISQISRYYDFFRRLGIPECFHLSGHLIGTGSAFGNSDIPFLYSNIPWLSVYNFNIDPLKGISIKDAGAYTPIGDHADSFAFVVDIVAGIEP